MQKYQNEEPNSHAVYAGNEITLTLTAGLYLFVILEIIFMLNATVRLVASLWFYCYEGSSVASAVMAFAIATTCFIAAVLCHKGSRHCLKKLKRHQIPG